MQRVGVRMGRGVVAGLVPKWRPKMDMEGLAYNLPRLQSVSKRTRGVMTTGSSGAAVSCRCGLEGDRRPTLDLLCITHGVPYSQPSLRMPAGCHTDD